MSIYTGFISGSVEYLDNGTRKLLPFGDKVMDASIDIVGETIFSETFSANGIKGKSAACPYKQQVSITFNTEDISWSYLQAILGSRSTARTVAIPLTESLTVVDNAGTLEATLSQTPDSSVAPIFGNLNGDDLTSTATVSGTTVTFVAPVVAGDQVIVKYAYAAPAGTDQIEFGKADVISEYSVYGVFKGCPENLIVVVDRAVISPEVSFGVGDGAASAGVKLDCLRNSEGTYATLIRA